MVLCRLLQFAKSTIFLRYISCVFNTQFSLSLSLYLPHSSLCFPHSFTSRRVVISVTNMQTNDRASEQQQQHDQVKLLLGSNAATHVRVWVCHSIRVRNKSKSVGTIKIRLAHAHIFGFLLWLFGVAAAQIFRVCPCYSCRQLTHATRHIPHATKRILMPLPRLAFNVG